MSLQFCSLSSGSSGNCQYISTDNVKILVDSGLSGKKVENFLKEIEVQANTIDGILVTHEHKDHIKGVGILSRRYDLPIYANTNTWKAMEGELGKINEKNIIEFKTDEGFELKDLAILPFRISHDSSEPVGFAFYHKNKKISYLTDTGYVSDDVKKKIRNSNLLVVESNHDVEMLKIGKYPWFLKKRVLGSEGHLSNEDAGKLITEVLSGREQDILLAHLSKENNFPELAYQTVVNIVSEKGIKINEEVNINLTYRDKPTRVFNY
ncbi:MBL fold metallo-hydrolase [Sporosalibacterium faouarense]|uniref:MBL fold metallo-hydrolase n=1 Tax=Sporosalibacterium faouarense TaxID=516123 RepID=UPI00141C4136|nr:MBL fold metallo-hydrolase [Sporosalibacterium faouarense]MTI46246.1 MBL fold metallo-hydrolase [Bacillota bacterium]